MPYKMKYESAGVIIQGERILHVATCQNCGSCVTATDKQRSTYDGYTTFLNYLDNNITCCDSPDYYFGTGKIFS